MEPMGTSGSELALLIGSLHCSFQASGHRVRFQDLRLLWRLGL